MTDVYWLEQTEADLPAGTDWLSASEAARINGMRFAKRRAEWLLGRWTAKQAVAAYWKVRAKPRRLASIEIRSAASGAPEVFLAGKAAGVAISLSHRAGRAVCAVAPPDAVLGCDLEVIEPRSDAFVSDYFTDDEQALVAGAAQADQPRVVTLLWSAKESALKALGMGLRLDTRCVQVSLADGQDPELWCPLQVRYDGQIFRGWWQSTASILRTLVAAPPPGMPVPVP
jgi:4'-phosphopantetheinyl transferase